MKEMKIITYLQKKIELNKKRFKKNTKNNTIFFLKNQPKVIINLGIACGVPPQTCPYVSHETIITYCSFESVWLKRRMQITDKNINLLDFFGCFKMHLDT